MERVLCDLRNRSLSRAKEWAEKKYHENSAVIGAVLDLGYCLNLTDFDSEAILQNGYRILKMLCQEAGVDLPVNR